MSTVEYQYCARGGGMPNTQLGQLRLLISVRVYKTVKIGQLRLPKTTLMPASYWQLTYAYFTTS